MIKVIKNKNKVKASLLFYIFSYIFLIVFAINVIIPFYVIVITSLTNNYEILSDMKFHWFPKSGFTLESYKIMFKNDILAINGFSSVLRGLFNTLWMTIPTVIIGLFCSGLAAFSYSKMRFKGKNIFFNINIAIMMLPTTCMTMPSYLWYNILGWANSYFPIIIPGIFGGAGTIFFLRQFFTSIPNEIFEAAKLDGMGFFKMYVKIMIPLTIPAFLAQFIFSFVGGYNNYLGPLLYLNGSPIYYTLQLTLSKLQGMYVNNSSVICAVAVISLLPLVIMFLICQKFFIEGIAVTGLK